MAFFASPDTFSNEWYTPPELVDAARQAMGGIDLDVASCDEAQSWIQAKRYFTEQDDALTKQWQGRVWMNPPYKGDMILAFVRHLISAHLVTQYCTITNAKTKTRFGQLLLNDCNAVCFIAGKVKFIPPANSGKTSSANPHASMICYRGDRIPEFCEAFNGFGTTLFTDRASTNYKRKGLL